MKNNVLIVLLLVFIGVLSGLGLLSGISNAVQVAVAPLVERTSTIMATQKDIDQKLAALDAKLNTLLSRPAGQPQQPQQPPAEDMNKVYNIPVGDSIIIGKKDAPITIQEFTDLQCPFCARFYPAVKSTLDAYPDKVRLLIKNYPLPFHPNARPAAKMAMAANEQGKYRGMMEALLDNGADVSEAKVKEYAKTLGLNYDKLMADVKNNDAKYEKQIVDDMELAGKVDFRGTPTFYINGKKTMARDAAAFKAEIEKILGSK